MRWIFQSYCPQNRLLQLWPYALFPQTPPIHLVLQSHVCMVGCLHCSLTLELTLLLLVSSWELLSSPVLVFSSPSQLISLPALPLLHLSELLPLNFLVCFLSGAKMDRNYLRWLLTLYFMFLLARTIDCVPELYSLYSSQLAYCTVACTHIAHGTCTIE